MRYIGRNVKTNMSRYIDADAFVEEHRKIYCENCKRRQNSKGKFVYEIGGVPCRACYIGDLIDDVDCSPTVDAEPVRHGHWILKERKGIREAWYKCSECNAYDLREIDVISHYCWSCGAKMDGKRREE